MCLLHRAVKLSHSTKSISQEWLTYCFAWTMLSLTGIRVWLKQTGELQGLERRAAGEGLRQGRVALLLHGSVLPPHRLSQVHPRRAVHQGVLHGLPQEAPQRHYHGGWRAELRRRRVSAQRSVHLHDRACRGPQACGGAVLVHVAQGGWRVEDRAPPLVSAAEGSWIGGEGWVREHVSDRPGKIECDIACASCQRTSAHCFQWMRGHVGMGDWHWQSIERKVRVRMDGRDLRDRDWRLSDIQCRL